MLGFVAVALKAGYAVIVVIAESHRDGLVLRLKTLGLDVDAASQQGAYIQLDVAKTLSTFMVNDMPDAARFCRCVVSLRQPRKPRSEGILAWWLVENVHLSWGARQAGRRDSA